MNGFADIFCDLLSHVLIPQRQFAFDLIIGHAGYADAARFSKGLQSCRDVDTVPINAIPLLDYIPDVDADSKFHLAVFGKLGIAGP